MLGRRAGSPARWARFVAQVARGGTGSYEAAMRFRALGLDPACVLELEPHADERGFFARTACEREFAAHGLPTHFPQSNLSRNTRRGTLRGMHYEAPFGAKIMRCVAGAAHDILIDLRPASPTRWKWVGVTLTAEQGDAIYVPAGFAHGFLTLADHTDLLYQMADSYRPDSARGFRWNDSRFDFRWPEQPTVVSERDSSYPDFDPSQLER